MHPFDRKCRDLHFLRRSDRVGPAFRSLGWHLGPMVQGVDDRAEVQGALTRTGANQGFERRFDFPKLLDLTAVGPPSSRLDQSISEIRVILPRGRLAAFFGKVL